MNCAGSQKKDGLKAAFLITQGTEDNLMQNETVTSSEPADDLSAIIDPAGCGERGARDIDGGKGAAVQEEAVGGGHTSAILPYNLPAIIDPEGEGARCSG